jgi:hypothetical protein
MTQLFGSLIAVGLLGLAVAAAYAYFGLKPEA